jgi:ATP-dependent helicase HrpB
MLYHCVMLPIHDVLDDLKATLAQRPNAVLVAPPGAGKSTVVPLELLDQVAGKIIVLEPRRLAARAVAARMAQTLGEAVGQTVGYRVRMDSRIGPATRIEVVTTGVFTRQILTDPELAGVGAVLFDEFHERSLDTDLGLALALDAQGVRPDLRLLVMSATIDGGRVAALMDGAPVIVAEGRMFPVETRHIEPDARAPLAETVCAAIHTALRSESGSILVFLPGTAEIRAVERRLSESVRDPGVILAPLYGTLDVRAQDRAIAPAAPGQRKIVLATAIAETSLTIEGVRVVIDSGLARKPVFDAATGLSALETVRVSQAAADQRRGRAGRTQPGVCYRLWHEGQTRALPPYDIPEILSVDLSGLALDLAQWGARAEQLRWLDEPPSGPMAEAGAILTRLGALDSAGRITAHGRVLAALPLAPRLAHMVATSPDPQQAAMLAVLLSEQGLGGRDTDLDHRLATLRTAADGRSKTARQHAASLAKGCKQVGTESAGLTLARAYPDRIAKAQGPSGTDARFLLVNGRAGLLTGTDALAKLPWLVVANMAGRAGAARITSAAVLSETEALSVLDIKTEETLRYDPDHRALRARRVKQAGAIILSDAPGAGVDRDTIPAAWREAVAAHGLGILPMTDAMRQLQARAAFATRHGWAGPPLDDDTLIQTLDDWFTGTALRADELDLMAMLRDAIGYAAMQDLDRRAPTHYRAPTGTGVAIDYTGAQPSMAVRLQELFGLAVHPTVSGVPITIELLSPARRPVQTTADLPGFWRGSYGAVRSDMRGRYPRHPWPEDPLSAPPTTRIKPKG